MQRLVGSKPVGNATMWRYRSTIRVGIMSGYAVRRRAKVNPYSYGSESPDFTGGPYH